MTLAELSLCYEAAAVPLRVRLAQLRRQLAQTQDPEEIFRLKRRILDMGLTKGTEFTVRKVAPLGDPVEINVRGYELSIRKADAVIIEVEPVEG